ncbi:MAG: tetratricopeptide repeat protein, partial [Proteobacteria bacterium]|nr:tetratricopeptide repeat protein [Pseudomonadota bacterium]
DKVNEAYQQIVKIRPNEPNLRAVLVDIYAQAGRIDDAENTLRSATADLPNDWMLKRRLIAFLDTYRSPETAEKEMENLIAANPDHTELQQMLAELYLKHNNVDKAVAVLEQSIARDDSDRQSLNARASLARITFRRGNRESAEQMVNTILEKSPNHSEALSAWRKCIAKTRTRSGPSPCSKALRTPTPAIRLAGKTLPAQPSPPVTASAPLPPLKHCAKISRARNKTRNS